METMITTYKILLCKISAGTAMNRRKAEELPECVFKEDVLIKIDVLDTIVHDKMELLKTGLYTAEDIAKMDFLSGQYDLKLDSLVKFINDMNPQSQVL